jgi:pSer/pThr/pTyr-binding forkhead associated (FHA) protein/tetratricopeptide (TPR) repeat protein
MYKLVISDDEGKTIIVPLVRDLITVGRQDGNTIRLTERNVSRQHARLSRTENGYRIEDLDSYNGVLLNGTRVEKMSDLKDGDRVGIGDYIIALKAEADTKAAAPAAAPRASAPPSGNVSPPARMVMVSAPAPGAEFSIAKGQVRIGRLEELDLCISHRSISREHARITQKDGSFDIEDLNSANGVRINGSPIKRGALKSGDIVELGQVRFRFVGPGESYAFDPSEEEQVAPLKASGVGPQRRTVAAIVVTAAVVGGALAFLDQGGKQAEAGAAIGEPSVTPEPMADSQPVVQQPNEEVRSQVAAALEGCRTALAAERFEDAARAAANGLALSDGDPDLADCKRSAELAGGAASAFEEGKRALAAGKFEEAYGLFANLPSESSYRDRPEVKQAASKVVQARLIDAKRALRNNPNEAQRLARSVLEVEGLSEGSKSDAQRILGLANKAINNAQAPSEASPAPRPRPQPAPEPAPEGAEGDSPAKIARSCLARGDQRCAVRALEGRTESAQELALLIETYRALGETKKAVKHMETFVQRYPSARQAPQYRLFIAKHEQ